MVGRRTFVPKDKAENGYTNGDANGRPRLRRYRDDDDDRPKSKSNPLATRFRDGANKALENQRREEIKHQLLEEVEREQFEKYRRSDDEIKHEKNKKLKQFYEQQNDALNDWLEVDMAVRSIADDILESFDPDADHDGHIEAPGGLQNTDEDVEAFLPDEEREKRASDSKKAKWAININVLTNILLLIAKVIAVFLSPSLSLIASTVDSALDLLCTAIVWCTNKLVGWRLDSLQKKFPVGRRRLEPIGILVFSVIMVISFAQVLQESVEKLLPSGDHSTATLGPVAIGAMVANVVVKGLVGLVCYRVKTTQVQALVQDCKTDVYFNTLSLIFPLIGNQLNVWWLDPTGAVILSLYVIYDWAETAFENITRLCGSAVDDRLQRKLTFLAWRFSPVVDGFKTITAYHQGDGIWVEFDILLNGKTPLMRSHDISETLQYCLEGLPEVDRAFVTVDYSMEGPSGHAGGMVRS